LRRGASRVVDAMTILSAMALVGHMDALRYPAWHMVSSVS